jgi:transmembrane sensor
MGQTQQYIEIVYKYLEGTADGAELISLLEWLKSDEANVQEFNELCQLWESGHHSVRYQAETELALQKINLQIEEFNKKESPSGQQTNKISYHWLVNTAAIFIILVALSVFVKYVLSPGSTTPTHPTFVTAYAPPSQKSQITLSDGTVVWLNSGTKIKYADNYGIQTREVYLEGEAYFDVVKNPKKPFLVHASSITVRAIGTSFNVKCYASDKTIETTLVEGRVQVKNESESKSKASIVYLNPNEKAIYSKKVEEIQIARYAISKLAKKEPTQKDEKTYATVYDDKKTIQSDISWKEQELIFENEAFEELAKRLERWYNINIRINDKTLLNNRYTGKFVNNESLEQVLRVIERTTPISYEIDKDNVIINSKR